MNNRAHTSIRQVSASADEISKANVAFRLLVDAVQDYAIFILDPEGRVLTWNSGARAIKGYTREEIVGKHFSVSYPQESIDSHWPERELALAEKEGRFRDEGFRADVLETDCVEHAAGGLDDTRGGIASDRFA